MSGWEFLTTSYFEEEKIQENNITKVKRKKLQNFQERDVFSLKKKRQGRFEGVLVKLKLTDM